MPQRLISSTQWEQVTLKFKQGYTSSVTRAGHALFLDFALALSRSWGKLFALALSRSFLDPQFRAFAFALSRPALIYYSHSFFALLDFSRYSIFRARTFALLDFRARNFVLVRLYTARTGQPEQDSQNRTARTGQSEQDSNNGTGRTRLP